MDQRDEAAREVARLREELRVAEARHRRLCQEAYDAGDRG